MELKGIRDPTLRNIRGLEKARAVLLTDMEGMGFLNPGL